MSEKQQVQQLIKSIQKGLNKYSLEQFNDVINGVLRKSDTDKDKDIVIVLDLICKEYNITKEVPDTARDMAFCCLTYIFCCIPVLLGSVR
jgi:hypothetical protein